MAPFNLPPESSVDDRNQEDGVEMNSMSGYTSEEELPPIGHGEHNLSE